MHVRPIIGMFSPLYEAEGVVVEVAVDPQILMILISVDNKPLPVLKASGVPLYTTNAVGKATRATFEKF